VLALCLAGSGAARAVDDAPPTDPCAAWPGEPQPLPRASDPDALRARWAALRVRELSQAALADEQRAPARAHRLWSRVLCLDPESESAAAGLARSPLVAIHAPPLVGGRDAEPATDPWGDLASPLAVARRAPPRERPPVSPLALPPASERRTEAEAQPAAPAPVPPPPPDPVGVLIDEVQEHLRAARYEQALARAERGRGELPADASPQRAAELEVLSATAALALDRKDVAAESLRRALAAQPMLTLDPMQTPPKVRRAFDRVRAGAEP
jgi:hypothetical protein